VNNYLKWDLVNHLLIQMMVCRDEIIPLGKPVFVLKGIATVRNYYQGMVHPAPAHFPVTKA